MRGSRSRRTLDIEFPVESQACARLSSALRFPAWRGGRAVEGSGLENRQGCKPLEGSNPSLSAMSDGTGPMLRLRAQVAPPNHARERVSIGCRAALRGLRALPGVSPPNRKISVSCPVRRGGRAAEGAPLLREYGVKPIEGSNPSLSATSWQRAQPALVSHENDPERWPSGLRRTLGKRVYRKVPWVRIPLSPPLSLPLQRLPARI